MAKKWTRTEKWTAAGVILVFVGIVASFLVPEVRRKLGLEKPIPPARFQNGNPLVSSAPSFIPSVRSKTQATHQAKASQLKSPASPLPSATIMQHSDGSNSPNIIGNNNSINMGTPSYPALSEDMRTRLVAVFSGKRASIAFDTRNATADTMNFANILAGVFQAAGWSYEAPSIVIAGTDVGADGKPIPIPKGIHIYAKSPTDDLALLVQRQLTQVAKLDSIIDQKSDLGGYDLRIFVGEP